MLGHEAIGNIIKIGKKVKNLKEGDDVIISWLPYNPQRNTQYLEWCDVTWKNKKIKSIIFTWADYTVLHNQFVSKIPNYLDKYSGSVIGCAVATGAGSVNNIANLKKSQSVAVFGAGGLGLFTINAARIKGADPIIAIDIDDKKLSLASEVGADFTINSKKEDPVKKIISLTNGGADFVFDMVGVPSVQDQTIESSKEGILGYSQGGIIILAGFPHSSRNFNPRLLINGQRTYIGSKGGFTNPKIDFPQYFNEYKTKELPLEKIITNNYKLNEINLAIEDLVNNNIIGRGVIEID